LHRRHDLARRFVLQQIAYRARRQHPGQVAVVVISGQGHNAHRPPASDHLLGYRRPFDFGQLAIQHRHVRLQPFDQRQRRLAIIRLAYHLDVGRTIQQHAQSHPQGGMIVGQQNANFGHGYILLLSADFYRIQSAKSA